MLCCSAAVYSSPADEQNLLSVLGQLKNVCQCLRAGVIAAHKAGELDVFDLVLVDLQGRGEVLVGRADVDEEDVLALFYEA